jgi:hypothetical protein
MSIEQFHVNTIKDVVRSKNEGQRKRHELLRDLKKDFEFIDPELEAELKAPQQEMTTEYDPENIHEIEDNRMHSGESIYYVDKKIDPETLTHVSPEIEMESDFNVHKSIKAIQKNKEGFLKDELEMRLKEEERERKEKERIVQEIEKEIKREEKQSNEENLLDDIHTRIVNIRYADPEIIGGEIRKIYNETSEESSQIRQKINVKINAYFPPEEVKYPKPSNSKKFLGKIKSFFKRK